MPMPALLHLLAKPIFFLPHGICEPWGSAESPGICKEYNGEQHHAWSYSLCLEGADKLIAHKDHVPEYRSSSVVAGQDEK